MYAVFTDLDGTMLDFHTYSYEKALDGIKILNENGVLLIPVSSKTLPEMKELHRELNLAYPFIFENGGGIAFPSQVKEGDFRIEILGIGIEELKEKFGVLREVLQTPIRTLLEMDIQEIIAETNLSKKSAKFAKDRLTSLPFLPSSSEKKIDILKANDLLERHKIKITKGGRYYHISDENADKGKAVRRVIDYIKSSYGIDEVISVGIGDSENDIPMLEVVDIPFLVKKYDNTTIETALKVRRTEKIGPAGFSEAMRSIFCD